VGHSVSFFSFGLGYYGLIVLCGDIFSTDGGEEGQKFFDHPALLYAAASGGSLSFDF